VFEISVPALTPWACAVLIKSILDKHNETINKKGLVLNPIGLRTDGGPQRHVLVTGCKSTQTSMSSVINNEWHGVLTYFFTAAAQTDGTWTDVFNEAVAHIKAHGYEQDPQLTGEDYLLNRQIFGGKNG
jgi:hypothetical protein